MDSAISVTIMLFILSMINERISNFIKLKFSSKDTTLFSFGNMRTKSVGQQEDDRTRRIIQVNLITGTIIALCLRANMIDILSHLDKPYTAIGWNRDLIYWDILTIPIGCFLTGCFISLGSKFWHDLLDLLLVTKNLKEKLVDARTYQTAMSADELREFVLTPESKLAQLAVSTHSVRLFAMSGVLAVGAGYVDQGGSKIGCIEVHIIDSVFANAIDIAYPIPVGKSANVMVPTKVVVTGSLPKVNSVLAGEGISNLTEKLGHGTLGAFVKDNVTSEQYLLSCFHVLNGDYNWKVISDSKVIIETKNGSNTEIADLYAGYRTSELDVAIAKLRPDIAPSNETIGNPKECREVELIDAISQTKINLLGWKSQKRQNGFIYSESWSASFQYPDGKVWTLNDLVIIAKVDPATNSYQPLTQGGDSGAIILDENGKGIAMLVGSDQTFSYGMKLPRIMKTFDISFI